MGYIKKTENPNMGRPKIGNLIHDIRIRVDEETYQEMKRIADKREISMSEVSREAIKEYLERRG